MKAAHKDSAGKIDDYINQFPDNIQEILQKIRNLIKETAPEAEEVMSYGVPAIKTTEVLVMYAAFKKHIGFYPTPPAIIKFKKELSEYETSKGAIKFLLDKPIPYNQIRSIVEYRVNEQRKKG